MYGVAHKQQRIRTSEDTKLRARVHALATDRKEVVNVNATISYVYLKVLVHSMVKSIARVPITAPRVRPQVGRSRRFAFAVRAPAVVDKASAAGTLRSAGRGLSFEIKFVAISPRLVMDAGGCQVAGWQCARRRCTVRGTVPTGAGVIRRTLEWQVAIASAVATTPQFRWLRRPPCLVMAILDRRETTHRVSWPVS